MARKKKNSNIEQISELKKEGYVIDPVTGQEVKATPERVEAKLIFAERLINEYGYSKDQIQTFPEFYIQKGSMKIGPADIVVFKDTKKTFCDGDGGGGMG